MSSRESAEPGVQSITSEDVIDTLPMRSPSAFVVTTARNSAMAPAFED